MATILTYFSLKTIELHKFKIIYLICCVENILDIKKYIVQ